MAEQADITAPGSLAIWRREGALLQDRVDSDKRRPAIRRRRKVPERLGVRVPPPRPHDERTDTCPNTHGEHQRTSSRVSDGGVVWWGWRGELDFIPRHYWR